MDQADKAFVQKKKPASGRVEDQKKVDKPLLETLKKDPFLKDYMGSTFSLRNGVKPHELVW